MLSNETYTASPQHRRTNSTPTAQDNPRKVPTSPATPTKQTKMHRRGLTLDPSLHSQLSQHQSQQDSHSVSINVSINHGDQHIMREAQQQRLARPGQQLSDISFQMFGEDQADSFFWNDKLEDIKFEDFSSRQNLYEEPEVSYEEPLDMVSELGLKIKSETSRIQSRNGTQSTLESNAIESSSSELEELRKILGLGDTLYKTAAELDVHRPCTPPNLINPNFHPITPMTMPLEQVPRREMKTQSRTAQSSPVRPPRNLKVKTPSAEAMKRGGSCQDPIMTPRNGDNSYAFPSPPNTAPLKCMRGFDETPIPPPSFMNLSTLNMSFPANENGYASSHHSPMSSHISPTLSSFQSSPELTHLDLFPELETNMPKLSMPNRPSQQRTLESANIFDVFSSPAKQEISSRSPSPPMDFSTPPIGGMVENTGITAEEIQSFIEGPDMDNKYRCRFPDCDKRFGRKENIRAHVQTHLGDRQFVCEDCDKRFVRQHDLKRHAKIHSGSRPYACACGCAFARHDALTRHRQRGMCSGAFPNTPRKESKRGRPKKNNRPELPERLEKAARTRQRVLEKQAMAHSPSSSSDYSLPSPPPDSFDDLDMRGSSPFDNLPEMGPMSFGVSPDVFSLTPPTSPGYSTGEPPAKGDTNLNALSFEPYGMTWDGGDMTASGQDSLFSGIVFLQS